MTVGGGGGGSQKGKGVATKWEWVGIKGDKGAESRSQCRFSGLISARVKKKLNIQRNINNKYADLKVFSL